jgi:hypothetical protein
MREAVSNKRKGYRNLGKCMGTENFEKYKVARIEVIELVRKV